MDNLITLRFYVLSSLNETKHRPPRQYVSQRSTHSEEELKTWCKNNSARLESGVILQADLSTINNDES